MIKNIVIFILHIGLICECFVTLPPPMLKPRKLKILNNRIGNINNTTEYLLELLAIIDIAMKVK